MADLDLPSLASYLNSPSPTSTVQAAPTYQPTGTGNLVTASLGSGIYGTASEFGSMAEAGGRLLGANDFADQARAFADRQRATAATWARPDLEGSWSPKGIAYQLIQGLPMLAGALGGGALAAAAVPEEAAGAGLAAAVGAGAAMFPSAVGGNVQRAEDYYGNLDRGGAAKALALGVPEAALQSILPMKLEGWLAKGVTTGGASLLARARQGAVKGALTQMPAAAATDLLTQQMGDPNRTFADRMQETLNSALMGGIQGGLAGGAFGAASPMRDPMRVLAKKPPDTFSDQDLDVSTKSLVPSGPTEAEEEPSFRAGFRAEPQPETAPTTPVEVGSTPWRAGFGGEEAGQAEATQQGLAAQPRQLEAPTTPQLTYQPAPGEPIAMPDRSAIPLPDQSGLTLMQRAQIMLQDTPEAVSPVLQGMDEEPFRRVAGAVTAGQLSDPHGVVAAEATRRYQEVHGAADAAYAADPTSGSPDQMRAKLQTMDEPEFRRWQDLANARKTPAKLVPLVREEAARRLADQLTQAPEVAATSAETPAETPDFAQDDFLARVKKLQVNKPTMDALGDLSKVTDKPAAQKAVAQAIASRDTPSTRLDQLGFDLGVLDAPTNGKPTPEFASIINEPGSAPTELPSRAPSREAIMDAAPKRGGYFDRLDQLQKALGQNIPDQPDQPDDATMSLNTQLDDLKSRLLKPGTGGMSAVLRETAAVEQQVKAKMAAHEVAPPPSDLPPAASAPAPVPTPAPAPAPRAPSERAEKFVRETTTKAAPAVGAPTQVPTRLTGAFKTATDALTNVKGYKFENAPPGWDDTIKASSRRLKALMSAAQKGDTQTLQGVPDDYFDPARMSENDKRPESLITKFGDHVPPDLQTLMDHHAAAEQHVLDTLHRVYPSETPRVAETNPQTQHDVDVGHVIRSTGEMKDAVGYLRQNGSSGLVREMAHRLSEFATGAVHFADPEGLRFDNDRMLEPDMAVPSSYNAALDRTNIYSSADLENSVLHEATHSATLERLAAGGPAAKEIQGIYDRVKARSDGDAYGLTNAKEMVAEAYSNPKFAEWMKSERVTTGSVVGDMWQEFKNAVFKLLGMPDRMRNLFDQVMDSSQRLMQEGRAVDRSDPAVNVETPRRQIDTALHQMNRDDQSTYDRAYSFMTNEMLDRKVNMSAKARPVALGWMTGDHIATIYRKWVPSLKMFTDAVRGREARADTLAKPGVAALNRIRSMDHVVRAKVTKLVEALAARTSQDIDPRKTWGEHTWLHDLPKERQDALRPELTNARADWNNLARIPGGAEAYEGLRAANSMNEYARQAHFMYSLLARDFTGNEGLDPFKEFEHRPELHDDPAVAEAFWKQKATDLQGSLTQTRAGLVDSIAKLQNSISDAGTKDSVKSQLKAAIGSKSDVDGVLRDMKRSSDQMARAPYFHLGRDGDYFVAAHLAKDAKGIVDDKAAQALRDRLVKGGFGNVAIMRGLDNDSVYVRVDDPAQMQHMSDLFNELHSAKVFDQAHSVASGRSTNETMFKTISPKWMQNAVDMLRAQGPEIPGGSDETMIAKLKAAHGMQMRELTRQLSALIPDNSYKSLYQRRENVNGFAKDMVKGFEHSTVLSARGLSALSMGRDIATASAGIAQDVRGVNKNMDLSANQKVAASQAAAEMILREQAHQVITPKSPLDGLRRLTHAIQIGISPAYVGMLLAQIPTLSLPELGKTHGYMKSATALTHAGPLAFKVMAAVLRGEDRLSFGMRLKDLKAAGFSDRDVAFLMEQNARGTFNISSFTEQMGGHDASTRIGHAFAVMNAMGRYAEMFPRVITAFAARDLYEQRAQPGVALHDFVQSKVEGSQQTWVASLNARQTTRAGSFGVVSPLMNQFMGWQIRMTEKLYREVHGAFAGDTPEAKREAQRFLIGHLTATAALSGTLGLPIAAVAAGAIDKLADWMTDSDSHDLVASYRTFLANTFGKGVGEVIARGLPRAVGIDFDKASEARTILGSSAVQILTEKRKLEDAEKDWLKSEAGSSLGFLARLAAGGRDLLNGDYIEAMQRAAPEAIEGLLSAYKLGQRGFVDKNGDKLPITANVEDILLTATSLLGDPAKEEEYNEVKKTETGLSNMRTLREQNIDRHLMLAANRGDQQMFQKWAGESTQFALDHPGLPPPISNFASSLEQYLREAAQARGLGVPLGTNLRDFATRGMVSYGNFHGQ